MEWSGPETIKKFDKRMAAATDGLREGLNWGELINSGGSPAPLLAIHTSHPTEQVNYILPSAAYMYSDATLMPAKPTCSIMAFCPAVHLRLLVHKYRHISHPSVGQLVH